MCVTVGETVYRNSEKHTYMQEFKSNVHLLSIAIMCTYRRLHNPLNDVLKNSLFNLKECPQETLIQTFTQGSHYGVDKLSL